MGQASARFELVAEPAAVVRLVREVGEFCARASVPLADARRLELCLEELLTNVATYGRGPAGPPRVWAGVSVGRSELGAEIEDDGPAFNPLEVPVPDLSLPVESRAVGGLGIHFVRSLADRLQYRRAGGRNHLALSMSLGRPLEPATGATGT